MARQIVVEVVGDASKFSKATVTATEDAGKFGAAINGLAMGAGIAAFNAVQNAIHNVISKVAESDKIFRDDQVSLEKMTQAFKNNIPVWDGNTRGVESYVAAQARLGFSANDVRDSLELLSGVTHNVAEAQKDEALAQDLARAHGMSLAEASGVLTKVHEGNFKALKSLGIEVGKHATSMDAMAAIYKNVKGQAEGYVTTSEGKLAAAQAKTTAAWVKIGAIVDRISQVVIPAVADAFSALADAIGPVMQFISDHADVFQAIGIGIGAMAAVYLATLIPALIASIPVWAAVAIGVIAATWPILAVGAAIAVLAYLFHAHLGQIRAVVTTVIGAVVGIFNNLKNTAAGVWSAISGGIGSFEATLTGLPGKIAAATVGLFDGIKNAFRAALNWVIGRWNSLHFSLPKIDAFGQHIGGTTISVPQIPYFHSGGTVPGTPGSNVLAMLQAGETVSKAGSKAGGDVHIHIGTFVGSGSDIDRLADMIAHRMRLAGAL